uniref:Uncharacterized protein n=1 Tax=Spironucleus salmonicida TaxID=348837 RepID=V6LU54_9EUKA|eukprot:EST44329.1 Hypothetical protein SS50377_15868 [Spironucleus salmonicida]
MANCEESSSEDLDFNFSYQQSGELPIPALSQKSIQSINFSLKMQKKSKSCQLSPRNRNVIQQDRSRPTYVDNLKQYNKSFYYEVLASFKNQKKTPVCKLYGSNRFK